MFLHSLNFNKLSGQRLCVAHWVWYCLISAIALVSQPALSNNNEVTFRFDVPQLKADRALVIFAKQAKVTMLFPHEQAKEVVIGPLKGRYSISKALSILFRDSRVEYEIKAHPKPPAANSKGRPRKPSHKFRSKTNPVIYLVFSPQELPESYPSEQDITFAERIFEEVVTTSTRAKQRLINDSPSPIDVYWMDSLQAQGAIEAGNMLRSVVPSFSLSDQPISDAATLVRPANMRGLAWDHTLMLVNGKRRHRSSVISWQGNGVSDGAQGPDFSSIPVSAVESVEVLRDGASAQYGSDAIAGVINVLLRTSPDEGQFSVKYGRFHDQGEQQFLIEFNKGVSLGSDGFLNFTGEYSGAEATNRSALREDVLGLIEDDYDSVPRDAMDWGTPGVKNDIKTFVNFAAPIHNDIQLYGYGNINRKTTEGSFFYRNPTNREGVYGDGQSLLIAALDGDAEACPSVSLEGNIPEQEPFNEVLSNDNCFSFQELIPGGYTPRFGAEIADRSLLIGLREQENKFTWDLGVYYGFHQSDFFIKNTTNPSFGPATQRDFDPGLYRQEDFNLNGDFTYVLNEQLALAFGYERRLETFTIESGEPASYTGGGLSSQGFSAASDGFPGFSPDIAGQWDRVNYAAYIDVDYDLTRSLLLTSALRMEFFDDFGQANNLKLGANWAVNAVFGIRSTFSTGFRVPTPGQANAINLTTMNVGVDLITRATIPASSSVARAVGAKDLEAEESKNLSFGYYFDIGQFEIQMDYFYVNVKDRLSLSDINVLTDSQRGRLVAEGVAESSLVGFDEFRFFANAFDTETLGVELKSHYSLGSRFGFTEYDFTYSYHRTKVSDTGSAGVDRRKEKQLENAVPNNRWQSSISHTFNDVTVVARANYFGRFYDDESSGVFDSAYLFDLELKFNITDHLTLAIGGDNIFGEKGCTVDDCSAQMRSDLGQIYSQYSPFGFNGSLWYSRLNYYF